MEYTIVYYKTNTSKIPFDEWLDSLDIQEIARILVRIDRLRVGNFGNYKPVGEGVAEIVMDSGPGYRIYYAKIGKTLLLLLSGGTKRTQPKDIKKAQEYFENYKIQEKRHDK